MYLEMLAASAPSLFAESVSINRYTCVHRVRWLSIIDYHSYAMLTCMLFLSEKRIDTSHYKKKQKKTEWCM